MAVTAGTGVATGPLERLHGKLKKRLAVEFPTDIDSYVFGGRDFILDVLRRVGLTDEQLASVERVNRRPCPTGWRR